MSILTPCLHHDVHLFSLVTDNLANLLSITVTTSDEIRAVYDVLANVYLRALQGDANDPINLERFFSCYPDLDNDKKSRLEKELENAGEKFKRDHQGYLNGENNAELIAYLTNKRDN